MQKTGILIVNLGTPDSPNKKDVAKYLKEFLMDKRVIDLPYWKRLLLVKAIIVPLRAAKVAKDYEKLWMEKGSPLMVYGKSLVTHIQKRFAENVTVTLAMRYQNPSIASALKQLQQENITELVVFPLFPQYASATTGSVAEEIMRIIQEWNVIPTVKMIQNYHHDQRYIELFAHKVRADFSRHDPDHVLFSYHGIPERHIDTLKKERPDNENDPLDYQAACIETSQLIAKEAGINEHNFSTSFQSRLGSDPWIQPYTDATIKKLAKKGVKRLLVVSPSFTADCLETTLEIGEEYQELFLEEGGEYFDFTRSLNDDPEWINVVYEMLSEQTRSKPVPA